MASAAASTVAPFARALEKFHSVVHPGDEARHDIETTEGIVEALRFTAKKDDWFVGQLATGSLIQQIEITKTGHLIVDNEPTARNIIRPDAIGEGTFGKVFPAISGKAYKKIKVTGNLTDSTRRIVPGTYNPNRLSKKIRGVFLEAWIQTVLGSDSAADRSNKICKIEGIYIEENVLDPSFTFENRFITFVIKMNQLSTNFETFIDNAPGDKAEFSYIQTSLQSLCNTLLYFKTFYGFSHRDLHDGNVMYQLGKLTIIDFGMSCINYNGHIYADPDRFPAGCWSFDMYIFLSSLLMGDNISDRCYGIIKNMFQNGAVNLYDIALAKLKAKEIRQSFHLFYPDSIMNSGITRYIPEYSAPDMSLAHLINIGEKLAAPILIPDADLERIFLERNPKIAAAAAAAAAAGGAGAGGLRRRFAAEGPKMLARMGNAPENKKKEEPEKATCCACKGGLFGFCCPCLGGGRRKNRNTTKKSGNRRKQNTKRRATRRNGRQ